MRKEMRRRKKLKAEGLELGKGQLPMGRHQVDSRGSHHRMQDRKGRVWTHLRGCSQPCEMLHEVTCQSGDCWEHVQWQHHRRQDGCGEKRGRRAKGEGK